MQKRVKFSLWFYVAAVAGLIVLQLLFFSKPAVQVISYRDFRDALEADAIEKVVITQHKIYGKFMARGDEESVYDEEEIGFSPAAGRTPWRINGEEYDADAALQFQLIPLRDENLIADLQAKGVDYRGRVENDFLGDFILNWVVPLALLIALWGFLFKRLGGGGSQFLNIGKNKAKLYIEDSENKITFKEVAGIDEAVEEVSEVVDFLKTPEKFTSLGAKLPKGLLLVGPPGTGKTLLAKAVAGEADVPFFSLSGSDFVEMFVGVGASRVRDLFKEAKAKAPCIIFIDEIDAIGKSRANANFSGGHDERENTLNSLLVEMDGFEPGIGIIMLGATNRPDVLDSALLRPGRFDRQVVVDRPDLKGRIDIFHVHTRKLPLASKVDLKRIAAQTPGFAGADIANVCNEAALLASRKNKTQIETEDFQEAIERVVAGLEKKNRILNPRERKIVAFHESGHAVVGHFTPGANPVQKVSIIPRGVAALGYTLQTPLEDRYLKTKEELLGEINGLLAGRAAEEIIFNEISTGAANDLERVAKIARSMVTVYGMSKRVPNLSLVEQSQNNYLSQGAMSNRRSEKIEQMIDEEVLEIIEKCYSEAKELLLHNEEKLRAMAKALLEKEVIADDDILDILGPRPEELEALTGGQDVMSEP